MIKLFCYLFKAGGRCNAVKWHPATYYLLPTTYSVVLALILTFLLPSYIFSQTIYPHIGDTRINELLDEFANEGIIELRSVVRPYSEKTIAESLHTALKSCKLNKRQQQEAMFYLQIYAPVNNSSVNIDHIFKSVGKKILFYKPQDVALNMFSYSDSLFTIRINPIIGIEVMQHPDGSGRVYRRFSGAGASATIGKNWGFFASFRDNHESVKYASYSYLIQRQGGSYKTWDLGQNRFEGADYSHLLGGVTYSWNWGNIGLLYDNFSWGNNFNGSNIFSGRTPPLAHISLNIHPVPWFEFSYLHARLNSDVIDSSRTYYYTPSGGYRHREVFHNKYLAANMFTFKPIKNLFLSLGNSIVYSDIGVHPAYLIPIMFYNPMDQNIGSNNNYAGQNSQIYADLSYRGLKHLHLYSSIFIDEISISRMRDKMRHSNYISIKGGMRASNLFKRNIDVNLEYTRTNPGVYRHPVPTTTFESNRYNLGHYLADNSGEFYTALSWHPHSRIHLKLGYTLAMKGPDYMDSLARWGLPYLDTLTWQSRSLNISASLHVYSNVWFGIGYEYNHTTGAFNLYSPAFYGGRKHILSSYFRWNL